MQRVTTNPPWSLSPERHYLRAMKTFALTGDENEARGRIHETFRWIEESVLKALVGDISGTDLAPGDAAQAFLDRVWEKSIFTMIPGWRVVNFYTTFQAILDGAVSYWTGQHAPAPISRATLAGDSLEALKLITLMVFSKEALEAPTELAERQLERDVVYAITAALNAAALDPGNAGIPGAMPASLTYGATAVPGTNDPSADIDNLVAAFAGDWEQAAFVSDPETLTRLGRARDSNGAFMFEEVGPRGGHIMGVPAYSTRLSATDSNGGNLILIDPTGCVVALDQVSLRRSHEADILMTDAFDSNAPASAVNLFQTEAVALKATLRTNWKRQRNGSVAYISGAAW